MKRWLPLLIFPLLLLAGAAKANLVVVHLAAFSCKYCAAVEAKTPWLKAELERLGATYSFAPIALTSYASFSAELFYFSVREVDPSKTWHARDLLFDAVHGNGLLLENIGQAAEWLHLKSPTNHVVWAAAVAASETQPPRNAVIRAQTLAEVAAITAVPAFVLVRNGKVLTVVQHQLDESPADLIKRLIDTVRAYDLGGSALR